MSFPNFLSCPSSLSVSSSTQLTRMCCHSLCSRLSHSLLSICKSVVSTCFYHFAQQMSNARGQPVLCGPVPDLTLSAGHSSLLFSDQGSQSFCRLMTARLQLSAAYLCSCHMKRCSILMRKICFSSLLLMCHMITRLMCISSCSHCSFYSDLYLEKEIHTQRIKAPEAVKCMKVGRITYALGVSLKSPKHAYFPHSFPQIL